MSTRKGDEGVRVLYKFRPLVSKDIGGADILDKYTSSLLQKGEIFFPPPSLLNDPFDSKLVYDVNASTEEVSKYLREKGFTPEQITKVVEQIKRKLLPLSSFIPKQDPDILRLFSATTSNGSILMWSHYGKDHTGICIGFRVHYFQNSLCLKMHPNCVLPIDDALADGYLPFAPVEYSDTRPKAYNIFKSTADDVRPFLVTKEKRWEYENEYRALLFSRIIVKNPIVIDTSEIVEIAFGVNSPDKLIDEVKAIIRGYPDGGIHVKLLRCKMSPDKYALDFGAI